MKNGERSSPFMFLMHGIKDHSSPRKKFLNERPFIRDKIDGRSVCMRHARSNGKKLAAFSAAVQMPAVLIVHGMADLMSQYGARYSAGQRADQSARNRSDGRSEHGNHGAYGRPGRRACTDAGKTCGRPSHATGRRAQHTITVVSEHVGTSALRTANGHDGPRLFRSDRDTCS